MNPFIFALLVLGWAGLSGALIVWIFGSKLENVWFYGRSASLVYGMLLVSFAIVFPFLAGCSAGQCSTSAEFDNVWLRLQELSPGLTSTLQVFIAAVASCGGTLALLDFDSIRKPDKEELKAPILKAPRRAESAPSSAKTDQPRRKSEFERWTNLDGSSLIVPKGHSKEGSFGEVRPVMQRNYGPKKNQVRYGAIKFLKPRKRTAQEYNDFREEMNKLSGFNHPNIAQLLDWPKGREMWMVMEMVGSENLSDYCGKVDGGKTLRFATDIFTALQLLHSKKVVHFDLKPHNIGVRDDKNSLALLDFGLSFTPGREHPGYLPTPLYRAPELFKNFSLANIYASDIYSAAISIMHLVSGELPWECTRNTKNLDFVTLQEEITRRGPTWKGLNNKGLIAFLKPLLHFDPKMRPTASEVLEHLERFRFNAWPKDSKYAKVALEYDAIRELRFREKPRT